MFKAMLCILAFTGFSAFAGGSVYSYVGLDHHNDALCKADLQIAMQKIERSGIGAANTLEGFCDGNSRPRITFVSAFESAQLDQFFRITEVVGFGGNQVLSADDFQLLLRNVVQKFESPDLLFLEIGFTNSTSRIKVIDLKLNAWPTLYIGRTYQSECPAKLNEITQDLEAKFGKVTGICAKYGSGGFFPVVFYLD